MCRTQIAAILLLALGVMGVALGQGSGGSSPVGTTGYRRTGLLYRDPRTVPGLVEVKVVPVAPGRTAAGTVDAVDLSSQMPPVGDQGSQGSCVAWAIGYYHWSHTQYKEYLWDLDQTSHQISPAFMYNQINGGNDYGAYFEDATKLLCEQGGCMMSDFPYDQNNYTNWPSESTFSHGIPHRGESQYYIDVTTDSGITAVKQRLDNGYTTVLGINVYSNFDYIENFNHTYCVADKYGSNRGGHGVCIVGYDDSRSTTDGVGAFKLVNSWGTGWGQSGYWWMSYHAVKTVSADLSQGYAYYASDKIGYEPTLVGRVRITHNARDRIGIRLGVGRSASPLWTKDFRQFEIYDYAITDRAFPANNLVFDMTEGEQYITNGTTDSVFVRCIDNRADGKTGTISYFAGHHLVWNSKGISADTPVSIPDEGTAVYARARIPGPHDVGCTRLILPAGASDSSVVVAPSCSTWNYGSQAESYNVRMKVGAFYNQTAAVSSHAAGTARYVTFPVCTLKVNGSLAVSCSTELATDSVRSNDKRTGTVTVGPKDAACIRILAPLGTLDSNTIVTPACTVQNNSVTAKACTVRMKVGATYNRTATTASLAAGAKGYLTFASCTLRVRGTSVVKCSTELTGDARTANDKKTDSVTVVMSDVGCIAITAPVDTVDSGAIITPACSLQNFGNASASYRVRMKVGTFYNETTSVSGHAGGAKVRATFAACTLRTRGAFSATCSTELAGDGNPANNKRTGSVFVRVRDMACTKLVAPAGQADSGHEVTPACSVYNRGNTTVDYWARMKVGIVYYDKAVWVSGHSPGTVRYVEFPTRPLKLKGALAVSCSTELADDQVASNNKKTDSVVVGNADMACTKLEAPRGTVDSGTVVTPACSVYNNGHSPWTYAVRMRIGTSYNQTVKATNHAPGTFQRLTFPVWTALQRSTHLVRCSTELAVDANPSDDRKLDSVTVPASDDASVSFAAPAEDLDSGVTVVPRVLLRYPGQLKAEAVVRLRIVPATSAADHDARGGAVTAGLLAVRPTELPESKIQFYDETALIAVEGGCSAVASFGPWQALETGSFSFEASAMVADGIGYRQYLATRTVTVTASGAEGSGAMGNSGGLPSEYGLRARPSLFAGRTTIFYDLPQADRVSLVLYDATGNRLSTLVSARTTSAGRYSAAFDASRLSRGVYLVRLEVGGRRLTEKLIVR